MGITLVEGPDKKLFLSRPHGRLSNYWRYLALAGHGSIVASPFDPSSGERHRGSENTKPVVKQTSTRPAERKVLEGKGGKLV